MSRERCPICTLHHPPGRTLAVCDPLRVKRWPLGPLVETLKVSGRAGAVAAELEVSGSVLSHAAEFGLSDLVADRWATRLGLHPVQVWGWEWFEVALSLRDLRMLEGGWRQAWEWAEQTEPEQGEQAA